MRFTALLSLALFPIAMVGLTPSCNNASMSGATISPSTPTGTATSADAKPASGLAGHTGPITPQDNSVDGEETATDCGHCMMIATTLAQKAGFQADMKKTVNCGSYKTDPSHNLCDIHFMNDMTHPVIDHDPRNSVLDKQVAVYCPCSCTYAKLGCGNAAATTAPAPAPMPYPTLPPPTPPTTVTTPPASPPPPPPPPPTPPTSPSPPSNPNPNAGGNGGGSNGDDVGSGGNNGGGGSGGNTPSGW